MKKIFSTILLVLVSFNSCSKDTINSPEVNSKIIGKVAIDIDKANAPANIATVLAMLTNPKYDTLTGIMDFSSDTTARISFQNVTVGTWDLKVFAKDVNGTILYKGETSLIVNQGITTNVYLTLTPVNDSTGNINIIVNWGTEHLGNAIYLDGSSGYVEIPQSESILSIDTAITIEAWVKPVDQFYNPVFTLGQDYGLEFAKGLYPGIFLNGVNVPNANIYWGRIMVPVLVAPNLWSHVAFSYSQLSGINVYINGNLIYHTSATRLINCETNLFPRIGCRIDPSETVFFNGGIDDLRLWKTVRTQNQIAQKMNNELTGNEYGLVAYWKFDEAENSGNIIHDSSPNHNDGRIHGNVFISGHK